MSDPTVMEKIRIDRWLWAARFFKTRAMATKAVNGGHVHLNGERVKPARVLGVADRLRIRRGHHEFEVEVVALSSRRGPATVARGLYRESRESIARREAAICARRLELEVAPHLPVGRPNKRQRRLIRDFVRGD